MKKRDREKLNILLQMRKSVPRLPGLKMVTKNQALDNPCVKLYLKWNEHELLYMAYPSFDVISIYPIELTTHKEILTEDLSPNPKAAMKKICSDALIRYLKRYPEKDPELLKRAIRYREQKTQSSASSKTGAMIVRLMHSLQRTESGKANIYSYEETAEILSKRTVVNGNKLLKILYKNDRAINSVLTAREMTKEEWEKALSAEDFPKYMRKFRDFSQSYMI
jgi:hypothetical protein